MLPSDDEHLIEQRRRGWWLLVARLSSGRTQGDAARALGLSASSSYGDFERGVTAPSLRQLVVLAKLYEVPLSTFTEPAATDEEALEDVTGVTSKRSALADEIDRARRAS